MIPRKHLRSVVRLLIIVGIAVYGGVLFYGGTLYNAKRERVLYEFPVQRAQSTGETSSPLATSVPGASVMQVTLSDAALLEKRRRLEEKIYGGRRSMPMPSVRELETADFAGRYTGQDGFDTYYKDVIAQRAVRIEEIRGSFPEIRGYEWASVLFRQGRGSQSGLFIYHQGHDGSPFEFRSANTVIETMLERGYDVAVFSMPGIGWNRIGHVSIKTWDGWGYVSSARDTEHDLFSMIDTGKGHFIRYFVEPVIATIDLAESRQRYDRIVMAGHSGGGWTATVAAALDPRIDHSVSYAGTLPFFARLTRGDRGDAEQFDTGFYRDFTYPLLYELASLSGGAHRTHTQLFHAEDTCCFASSSVAVFQRYLEGRGYRQGRDLRVKVLRGRGHFVLSDAILDVVGQIGPLQATR